MKGACTEAKQPGARGGRDGAKGGRASKGVKKVGMNFKQKFALVSLYRVYEKLPDLLKTSSVAALPKNAVEIIRELLYGEFASLEKARMREVIYWWLLMEEKLISSGKKRDRKCDLSRKQLEMYCIRYAHFSR